MPGSAGIAPCGLTAASDDGRKPGGASAPAVAFAESSMGGPKPGGMGREVRRPSTCRCILVCTDSIVAVNWRARREVWGQP